VNWVTIKRKSYENRYFYNNGRLAICAKELVFGGKYSPDCLPLVVVDEEIPFSSSLSSFALGDRVLVDPECKFNGVRHLVSIQYFNLFIIYFFLWAFTLCNSVLERLGSWWD